MKNEHLLIRGKKVTVVEMMDDIMKGEYIDTKMIYLGMLNQYGVTVMTETGAKSIQSDSVTVEKEGKEQMIPATDVLTSVGLRPDLSVRASMQCDWSDRNSREEVK